MSSTVSLTELRQRLFQLADQVIDTGEPVLILRRGVRLRLVREEVPAEVGGRLARLAPQSVVVGAPLAADESPAQWSADPFAEVAEPEARWSKPVRPRSRRTP